MLSKGTDIQEKVLIYRVAFVSDLWYPDHCRFLAAAGLRVERTRGAGSAAGPGAASSRRATSPAAGESQGRGQVQRQNK